ncbi:hypothetical protein [Halovenus halobia]|uniref:hypothetical protein n=1 Tax=Halovenus halobia TaxID=3396622 RepID=UPI003F57D944
MSNESSRASSADGEQVDERVAKFMGAGSGVMSGVALAAASYFVFDTNALLFGALVGLLSAVGSSLFMPWILQQSEESSAAEETTGFDTTEPETDAGGINTAAFGAGLEIAAVGMFTLRLVFEDILLAVGGGVAIGLGVFLVGSVLFGYAE